MDIKDFLVDEESTMLECMALLDKAAQKVMFVTREGRFVAAVTDGDIRRWILKKGSLDAKIKEMANYAPRYLRIKDRTLAKTCLKKWSVEAIPILNNSDKIVSIVLRHAGEIKNTKKMTIPVVIMAGGLGTRLYPFTKILPKPLIPIGEIPVVEHIINRFNSCGVDTFF
ncbi:MAG TPA: sugar phosphate nucleotidyltransferase, partial [Clostridia bacterium]|nr:sugar phosphate nucleotidyltransferase [Clostridia bacterium]